MNTIVNTVDGKMLQRNNVVTLEKMAQRYNIIPLQHFFGVYFCLRDFCWCEPKFIVQPLGGIKNHTSEGTTNDVVEDLNAQPCLPRYFRAQSGPSEEESSSL